MNSSSNSQRSQTLGKTLSYTHSTQQVSGTCENGKFKLTVYEEGIIRIQATRSANFESNPYSVIASPSTVSIEFE